jgi:NAD+ synthase
MEVSMEFSLIASRISQWIRIQVERAGANGVVMGLSGGIDSSVLACLSKIALGDRCLGLILPCHSLKKDIDDAMRIANQFKIPVKEIDLGQIYDLIVSTLPDNGTIARANIKPRLRMIVLYYFANMMGYLVAGSGNKSEIMVGYFTKYGDGGVDILPLGDLLKSEIRGLASYLGIPEDIISKTPSAGLWEGQTDEDEMGITYEKLDSILKDLEVPGTLLSPSPELEKVKAMVSRSHHKRTPIPIYRISEDPFSL